MPLLEENRVTEIAPSVGDDSERTQRRQMLVALALLLAALILVLIKDRDFWFPPEPPAQSEAEPVEEPSSDVKAPPETASTTTTPPPVVHTRPKAKRAQPPVGAIPRPAPALAPVVMTRAVLPPLEVEVVAGDEHRTIQATTNSVRVDLQPRTPVTASATTSSSPGSSSPGAASGSASPDSTGIADATARVHLSPGAADLLSRPVQPNYPLLAKEMKVQGAVVLEALIGRDGNIQDLHVLSGPTILSTAAREAVKQWRFRPYLQSGQAVETEARITVNFTISTQ
ncbi:MAG: TonB family protein [Terriglobales bacterium]